MKHNSSEVLSSRLVKSKLGYIIFVASIKGLRELQIHQKPQRLKLKESSEHQKLLDQAEIQLAEYLNGERQTFSLSLDLVGTAFQKQAWQTLTKIPYGKTISYSEQAARMGEKKKTRAVGQANGKNPLPIIIPCHRVIAKDGGLGGYSAGLDVKKILLALES